VSPLSLRLIRAAFACLLLGVALAMAFAFDRNLGVLARSVHAELNAWGFVSLLIYGFGNHMLPRFAGRALPWPRVAEVQSWLAIGGVLVGALGWTLAACGVASWMWLAGPGAALQALAALAFAAQAAVLARG